MNFKDYENTVHYPTKSEYTTTFYYKNGQLVYTQLPDNPYGPTLNTTKGATVERVVDEARYQEARTAFRDESTRLYELFKQDLFEYLGVENNPKKDKLFSTAWEMGHSGGYSEVLGFAEELVELIQD